MSGESSDYSRIEQGRFLSGRLGTTRRGLTQNVILVDGDPFVHFLDPNGADRSIALPALTSGGDWRIVANVGSANILSITDAVGNSITSLIPGESVLCFGSTSEWVAFRGYASLGDVFGPAGVGHKIGLVPDPGPTSGLHRFLEDDGTWTSVTTAGIVDAYKIINDGVNSAVASGLTALRIRSSDSSVVLVATNNDPTFGDVVNFTVAPGAVDHDLLLHFVANKHIDHTAVSISTSEGIQGGGDISATRSLKLDYSHLGTASPALTDTVSYFQTATHFKSTWTTINGIFQHNALSGYVANQHIDHSVVSIIAGSGLSGGGDITTSRTLNISYGALTTTTSPIAADLIAISHSGTMESINFLAFNSALDFNSLLNIGGVAHLASPTFTGVPLTPTAAPGTATTQIASTAFVDAARVILVAADALKAPLASPALTTPTLFAPTISVNVSNAAGQVGYSSGVINVGDGSANHTLVSSDQAQTLTNKTIAFASNTLTGVAPLASPALTGVPTAPTATVGTNTTQLATTAFVLANGASAGVASFKSRTGAVVPAQGDYTSDLIPGNTTGTNALAGNIGEFVSSSVLIGSAVPLTNNVNANITSIVLTSGDWDISANVYSAMAGSTFMGYLEGAISTVSATLPARGSNGSNGLWNTDSSPTLSGANLSITCGPVRLSISATTTVYLVGVSTYTTGTNALYGFIGARRVR